jgi:NodT family efflux transporter outer membrane factor (OMF) lipoprotein
MMRQARRAWPLVLVLAGTGCSLAPSYQLPKVAAPTSYKEDGPWTSGTPADQLPRGAWWKVFDDSTLDALEDQAAKANPNLDVALANYDGARAALAQARSSLFPNIFMEGSDTRNRQSDNRPLRGANQPDVYDADTLGIGADYEVDLWGQVRSAVDAGTAETQAAAADLEDARLSIQAELADDYFRLRGLDAQAKLLSDTVSLYDRALQLVQDRHEGGIASGLDVARAQTQLDSAKAAEFDVAAQRALYEHAIAALVGQTASTFALAPAVVDFKIPAIPVGMPSTLLQRRPDVAAAERRVAASDAIIGATRASFFPVLTIDASGGYQNTGVADWLASPNKFWSIGPSFLLNLFDAGYRDAEVAQAQARFEADTASYRVLLLKAFRQVEDNLALLNDYAQESEQQDQAIAAAQQAEDLSLDRYRAGMVNYLEAVTAQTADLQAKSQGLALTTRRLDASVNLIRAIGGGWTVKDLPPDSSLTDYGNHSDASVGNPVFSPKPR